VAVEFAGSMSLWSRQFSVFFLFLVILVAIHALVVFGIGRWRKIDIETLCVASQATVGGPSTALALAISKMASARRGGLRPRGLN
jgi:uncharacterized membrane protein